jgi:hypothetical protein
LGRLEALFEAGPREASVAGRRGLCRALQRVRGPQRRGAEGPVFRCATARPTMSLSPCATGLDWLSSGPQPAATPATSRFAAGAATTWPSSLSGERWRVWQGLLSFQPRLAYLQGAQYDLVHPSPALPGRRVRCIWLGRPGSSHLELSRLMVGFALCPRLAAGSAAEPMDVDRGPSEAFSRAESTAAAGGGGGAVVETAGAAGELTRFPNPTAQLLSPPSTATRTAGSYSYFVQLVRTAGLYSWFGNGTPWAATFLHQQLRSSSAAAAPHRGRRGLTGVVAAAGARGSRLAAAAVAHVRGLRGGHRHGHAGGVLWHAAGELNDNADDKITPWAWN